MNSKKLIIGVVAVVIIFALGLGVGLFYSSKVSKKETISSHTKFLLEVYDKIKENYWKEIGDEDLSNLFEAGIEKVAEKPVVIDKKNKEGIKEALEKVLDKMGEEEKEEFSVKLADIVVKNLEPFGRSALYSPKEEKKLTERVENIDPETGEKKPTVSVDEERMLSPEVAYIKIEKISPSTFEEFKNTAFQIDTEGGKKLNSLILDLRDNVGGSIDILPYFLGPFIGNDQYAYDFYHKGEKKSHRTKTGWLNSLIRYKKVVILINGGTQSSAEVMAAVLKRYNVGVLLGEKTKGWGTVEKVFDIENQINPEKTYSLFLVHSLTLRDDNQPIEGRGVTPNISLGEGWQEKLMDYYSSEALVEAVEEVL